MSEEKGKSGYFGTILKTVGAVVVIGVVVALLSGNEEEVESPKLQPVVAPSGGKEELPTQEVATAHSGVPVDYNMSLSVNILSPYSAEFTVETDILLPVDIMAGFDLKGQKPTDTYIGYSEKVRLSTPKQSFTIDASKQKDKLPSGDFIAEVTFYPRWGAKEGNPKARHIKEKISSSVEISLTGSGESSSVAAKRKELQKWVIENVIIGTAWDERRYVNQLGDYKTIKADHRLHEGYYFPDADMTLLVNTYKGSISTWRIGRASK